MTRGLLLAGTFAFGVVALHACTDAEPALPAGLDALTFDTVFQVGAAEGEPWQAFEGLWDVDVDPDGRVAILDLGGPAVHVYDDAGAHVASIDAHGLEPGQLDRPSGIAWASAGELLVWDPGSSWISRFRVQGGGLEYSDRWRAFAFGETGFCAFGGRTYLSYFLDGSVVHEVVPDEAPRSFGPAPAVVGVERLGPELQEIAIEELTPSALVCTAAGVVDASFVQSSVRLHDRDGTPLWSHELDAFRPIEVYSDDGIGLGRAFDQGEGSHLLRSAVAWGPDHVLLQHEIRTREIPDEGDDEVLESRLIDLSDGSEVARTRDLPLVLAAGAGRLYLVHAEPFPTVTAVAVR